MTISIEQLKELVIFHSWNAMHFQKLYAQADVQIRQLQDQLGSAERALQVVHLVNRGTPPAAPKPSAPVAQDSPGRLEGPAEDDGTPD